MSSRTHMVTQNIFSKNYFFYPHICFECILSTQINSLSASESDTTYRSFKTTFSHHLYRRYSVMNI